jgi:hypothetical protein
MNQVLREGFARGATTAVLEVRSNSIAAKALYAGLGFRVVGIRKDYYGNPPEDGLTMVLKRRLVGPSIGVHPYVALLTVGLLTRSQTRNMGEGVSSPTVREGSIRSRDCLKEAEILY